MSVKNIFIATKERFLQHACIGYIHAITVISELAGLNEV